MPSVFKWAVICVVLCVEVTAYGQAGLREALERLDTNKDGYIERDEITPLARPYLERITRERRISLDGKPVEIHELQEAARIYYAVRNGASDDFIRYEGNPGVRPFEPDDDQVLVPQFGLPEVRYPYTQANLTRAKSMLRRYDYNRDGYIDRREAARSRWSHTNPFLMDLNKDDRISMMELTQRYARRDLVEDTFDEFRQRARRVGNGIEPSTRDNRNSNRSSSRSSRSTSYLTSSVMENLDRNRNGRLETTEANRLGVPALQLDVNGDTEISREELQEYLAELQALAGDTTTGLPAWFFEQDANRDGQISMPEFTNEWTTAKRQEFAAFDLNGDGLLTEQELTRSAAATGADYTSQEPLAIPPQRTIVSEIEVADDFLISDLNVQLWISHTYVGQLDAYLTGPNGQRVELFTEVGSSGNHFSGTVFDDQSRYAITKGRTPFTSAYIPEGVLKREPGLSVFNGKSVKGVWQLIIRASRSDRFGMLHSWGLTVRPFDDIQHVRPTPEPETPPKSESAARESNRSR